MDEAFVQAWQDLCEALRNLIDALVAEGFMAADPPETDEERDDPWGWFDSY